jgi:putative heme iron utilization protein
MGRNGAQHTPEAINQLLLSPQETYHFEAASYYNLQADEFISGHSDVDNLAVANLVVNAVAAV